MLESSDLRLASASLQLVEVYDLPEPEAGEELMRVLRPNAFLGMTPHSLITQEKKSKVSSASLQSSRSTTFPNPKQEKNL
jgi:hypothetical protein